MGGNLFNGVSGGNKAVCVGKAVETRTLCKLYQETKNIDGDKGVCDYRIAS